MRKLIVASMITLLSSTALADEPQNVTAAARAFAEGQSALLNEDYERAAQSFELADSIVPSKEALRSAIRARQQLNQLQRAASLAATLVLRDPDDPTTIKLTADIIASAQAKFARVRVTCTSKCSVSINKKAISFAASQKHVFFAAAGRQELEAGFSDGQSVAKSVTLETGKDAILDFTEPPAKIVLKPKAEAPKLPGVSPGLTIFGGVVTVGLAAAATWSSLQTAKAHDDYVADPQHPHDLYESGRSKQLRTNILWAGTAVAGVGTALVAIFWTRWSDRPMEKRLSVTPVGSDGAAVGLGGTF